MPLRFKFRRGENNGLQRKWLELVSWRDTWHCLMLHAPRSTADKQRLTLDAHGLTVDAPSVCKGIRVQYLIRIRVHSSRELPTGEKRTHLTLGAGSHHCSSILGAHNSVRSSCVHSKCVRTTCVCTTCVCTTCVRTTMCAHNTCIMNVTKVKKTKFVLGL